MNKKAFLILRIIIAIILIQTLRYKFTAHPDSVYIFTKIGIEPFGRIGIGVLELILAILIVIPRFIWAGALGTAVILGGAIMMHLTLLGIEVNNDEGTLFYTALGVFLLNLIVLFKHRKDLPIIGSYF